MELEAMSDEDRIINLEMGMAHLEQQFEELNGVVLSQAKTIDALKAKLKITESKLEELEYQTQESGSKALSPAEIAARDKPPHY